MKIYRRGRFSGSLDGSKNLHFIDIVRWKLSRKKTQGTIPAQALELVRDPQGLTQKEDFICWLSHASFLIQLGGRRILIDPVFYDIPLYRRYVDFPYTLEELGEIDYLLISHTHYDHLDKASVRAIEKKHPKALLPLKMCPLLQEMAPSIACHELDWDESYMENDFSVTLVSARHWGRRGLFDKNRVLWGGYVISFRGKTIYFAGDTASGDHFDEIGRNYDIDIALMPIGAYSPEFIMKNNHLNPAQAFDAFRQLHAKTMIPMHYGTYRLTDEPMDEPLRWMHKIAKRHPGTVHFLKAGETFVWRE